MTPLELYLFLPAAIFVYLAIGAVVIGIGDRCDPAYDYGETWWIWMLVWPFVLFAVIVVGLCEWTSAPFRWIYHRVRLWGRDKEL